MDHCSFLRLDSTGEALDIPDARPQQKRLPLSATLQSRSWHSAANNFLTSSTSFFDTVKGLFRSSTKSKDKDSNICDEHLVMESHSCHTVSPQNDFTRSQSSNDHVHAKVNGESVFLKLKPAAYFSGRHETEYFPFDMFRSRSLHSLPFHMLPQVPYTHHRTKSEVHTSIHLCVPKVFEFASDASKNQGQGSNGTTEKQQLVHTSPGMDCEYQTPATAPNDLHQERRNSSHTENLTDADSDSPVIDIAVDCEVSFTKDSNSSENDFSPVACEAKPGGNSKKTALCSQVAFILCQSDDSDSDSDNDCVSGFGDSSDESEQFSFNEDIFNSFVNPLSLNCLTRASEITRTSSDCSIARRVRNPSSESSLHSVESDLASGNPSCRFYCSNPDLSQEQEAKTTNTLVSFASPLVTATHAWEDEEGNRKGVWETYALDRFRFRTRCEKVGEVLNPILTPEHRLRIFEKISTFLQ